MLQVFYPILVEDEDIIVKGCNIFSIDIMKVVGTFSNQRA
jgi:hypothetical protein